MPSITIICKKREKKTEKTVLINPEKREKQESQSLRFKKV